MEYKKGKVGKEKKKREGQKGRNNSLQNRIYRLRQSVHREDQVQDRKKNRATQKGCAIQKIK